MTTILYASPVFGPIHSRRLGISLGINLLPADGKICSIRYDEKKGPLLKRIFK